MNIEITSRVSGYFLCQEAKLDGLLVGSWAIDTSDSEVRELLQMLGWTPPDPMYESFFINSQWARKRGYTAGSAPLYDLGYECCDDRMQHHRLTRDNENIDIIYCPHCGNYQELCLPGV